MRFFFDHNMPSRLAKAIDFLEGEHGCRVRHLITDFPPNTKDTVWIRSLGTDGDWVVLTRDARIYRNDDERQAWKDTKLPIVYVTKAFEDLDFWIMASKLLFAWPEIRGKVSKSNRLAFTLTGSGKLKEM